MTDMNIYFGRPGSLVQLHHPRGDLRTTRIRPTGSFQPGDGGAATERRLQGAREYVLGYRSLSRDDFHTLLAYDQGHNGIGPWAFIDPGQRNMLTVNQSAATSHTNDESNFSIAGSGWSMDSSPTLYRRGPRSLKLTATYASQTATLSLDTPYAGWYGVPVADRDHTFSFYARTSVDNSISVAAGIVYLDANGATLSTTTSNVTVAASGAWSQIYVTADASGAAYCNLSVAVSGASAGALLYLDEFMLNEGTTPDTVWSPGTGVLPVVIKQLEDTWPWMWPEYRDGPAFVLQEDTS